MLTRDIGFAVKLQKSYIHAYVEDRSCSMLCRMCGSYSVLSFPSNDEFYGVEIATDCQLWCLGLNFELYVVCGI